MLLFLSSSLGLIMHSWTHKVGHHNQEPEKVGGDRAQEQGQANRQQKDQRQQHGMECVVVHQGRIKIRGHQSMILHR